MTIFLWYLGISLICLILLISNYRKKGLIPENYTPSDWFPIIFLSFIPIFCVPTILYFGMFFLIKEREFKWKIKKK